MLCNLVRVCCLDIELHSQGRKKAMNQMWDKIQGMYRDNAMSGKHRKKAPHTN